MRLWTRQLAFLVNASTFLLSASLVFAQSQDPYANCVKNGVATLKCVPLFFGNIINGVFGFAAIAAVFFVVIAGIKFLTSGGDQEKVGQAKKTITFALVGLLVILLSFAVIRVVATITNIDCKVLGIDKC